MSARALDIVETWVYGKIEAMFHANNRSRSLLT
jgi:hypothetical protein